MASRCTALSGHRTTLSFNNQQQTSLSSISQRTTTDLKPVGSSHFAGKQWPSTLLVPKTRTPFQRQCRAAWVRENGKIVRKSADESEESPQKFVWKRKGYEASPETQRPAYEKPLSARNEQILMALLNQERTPESVGKLMEAWKEELGLGSLITLLKELGRLKEHAVMQQVFDWAKSTPADCDLHPGVTAYTTVIAAYTRCCMMAPANALLKEMQSSGLTPDLVVYNALLIGYARQGLFAECMALVTKLKDEGFRLDQATYKELVTACARSGAVTDILRIFSEMRESSVRAEYTTYRTALDAFNRINNWDGIMILYEQMVAQGHMPDRHVCSQILRAYEKKGYPERAEKVFQIMRKAKIPFTTCDYGNLIQAYVNVGRLEDAEGVLQDMRARNVQPDINTYDTLLDGYGRQGRYEEAESVLADMKQVGVRPQPETFQKLMMAYTRGGHCHWAESVHSDMQKEGFAPSVVTYTMLISAYGKGGSLGEVLRLLEEMQNKGVQPNRATYNCLVSTYCRTLQTLQFDLARDVLLEMTTRGHMPDESTYYGIVDAYRKGSVGENVLSIYKEALRLGSKPTHPLSFALIEKLVTERQYEKAEKIYSGEEGTHKRPAAYAEVMMVYASHGMSGYAYKLLEKIHPKGVNNSAIFHALMSIAGQDKRPQEVARLFTQLQKSRAPISYRTILALLDGYAAQGSWQEVPRALELFHTHCKNEHGKLTQRAFALIFETLSRGGKLEEIPVFYEKMKEAGSRKSLNSYSAVLLALKGNLSHVGAPKVWEVLEGFRLPVHKVIRNILSDKKQEGAWDLSLHQALDKIPGGARESLLAKRGFFNALLDILWAEKKRSHAANVVTVALRKGVYAPGRRKLPLRDAPGASTGHFEQGETWPGEPPEWWVDMRHTSPGAACAILSRWLMSDAREGIVNVEAGNVELPEKVDLYFGRTVEEGATYQEGAEPSHLEAFTAVTSLVAELGLPFRAVEGDTAILTAPARELRRWVLESDASERGHVANGHAATGNGHMEREPSDKLLGTSSRVALLAESTNGQKASVEETVVEGNGLPGTSRRTEEIEAGETIKRRPLHVAGTDPVLGTSQESEATSTVHVDLLGRGGPQEKDGSSSERETLDPSTESDASKLVNGNGMHRDLVAVGQTSTTGAENGVERVGIESPDRMGNPAPFVRLSLKREQQKVH